MKTSAVVSRLCCFLVLLFAFGVAVYRAKTQAIAHDEALTYEWFLDGGVYRLFLYNPTNHVLLTLLAKPIVWTLGVTELKLRLPGLFGTAVYLIGSYLLSRKLFGDGLFTFISVALLSLNPEIMDLMAAARGYLLGIGALTAAMYLMARLAGRGEFDPADSEWRWGCFIASLCFGLSVVANFTNVVPVAGLMLAFSLEAMGGLRALLNFSDKRLRTFATYFFVPGITMGFSLLWPFLLQVRRSTFHVSLGQGYAALQNIFKASFLHKWTDDVYGMPGIVNPATGWQASAARVGVYLILPAILALAIAALALGWRSGEGAANASSAHSRIFAGAAVASVAAIVFLHLALNVDYPVSRYCLFLIPLFTLSGLLAILEIEALRPTWRFQWIGLLGATAILADYSLAFQTKEFRYTAYDVISRDLYLAIEKDAAPRKMAEVRVGGTWWYEPEINFYRRKYNASWMLPFDIKDRSYFWQTPNSLTPSDYDYFVFVPESDPGLSGPRVRTIYHDARTQATIIAIAHDADTPR